MLFADYKCRSIMSEINPTDHKSITARHCHDEGFRGAVCELVQPERDIISWLRQG